MGFAYVCLRSSCNSRKEMPVRGTGSEGVTPAPGREGRAQGERGGGPSVVRGPRGEGERHGLAMSPVTVHTGARGQSPPVWII